MIVMDRLDFLLLVLDVRLVYVCFVGLYYILINDLKIIFYFLLIVGDNLEGL